MVRNVLTERYLAEVDRRGIFPGALVAAARREVDLDSTSYFGRVLDRPVFLTHAEQEQLARDLEHLHEALTSLPDRLFGGDLEAYARAIGLAGPQIAAILRAGSKRPTRLMRIDLYHDGAGFRLMEANVGSPVGGGDNALLNRAFLTNPGLAEFVAEYDLTYPDTMQKIASTIRAECGLPDDARPLVVATDTPQNLPGYEKLLTYSAAQLSQYGLDVVARPINELTRRGGRVWLEDRPVDVIYRVFGTVDLLTEAGAALINPVLEAVEAGEVALFTPIDDDLYDPKGALALLTDEAHRERFAPEVVASLDRIVPWTRMVRDEPVTVAGERVDLREYAHDQREELVLKPTSGLAGRDVMLGWAVDDRQWQRRLAEVMDGGYVLQRRIRPVPEPFPTEDGPRQWVLNWGAYLTTDGYGGMLVRAGADLAGGVINMATGASATCCFHATS